MTSKEKKKVVGFVTFIIVISVAVSVLGSRLDTDPIVAAVQKAGIWAPLVFIFFLTAPSVIAPLNGTPILIAGYLVFESKVQIYAYLAFLISSSINFYISRKWGRAWVTRLVGRDDMEKVDSFTKDYGILSLIFLRLLTGPFSDYISYAYGFTNIKYSSYMVINILVLIPWLLLWNFYIFPRVENIADFSVWILITLIPVLIISGLYWKFKIKKK